MTSGSGLFILLFLLRSHCPHFIYIGDEGNLNKVEGINIQTDRGEQIRFSEIFTHIRWDEYKNNPYPQVCGQRLVALDASASLVAHEKLTSELAGYLEDNDRVYVTLIRLGGENCEKMLDNLRKTNRSAHMHLVLMYTCHREMTNGTKSKLNHYLILVDAHSPEVTNASALSGHHEERIITIFSNENSQSGSIYNNPNLEENEVCFRKCKLYCINEDEARPTDVAIGESWDFIRVSRPSNVTIDAFYRISDPLFGATICLNCTRVQQQDAKSPSDSHSTSMCHSGFTSQLQITIVFTILIGMLLYTLKRRYDWLESRTHLNNLESAERQWILKQRVELLLHILCCLWNLCCSCHPDSPTVSLRYDHIVQSLISWLFMAANVIVPYLSFFIWPPGAWIYFVASAIALTGFVIQVVVISEIDLELLPNTTCSLTGRELSVILVASTSWGAVAVFCLCALVTVPPIVARCYYSKPHQRNFYVICGAELAIAAIRELLSTIIITVKNVALGRKSSLSDSQVSLAARLFIMLAAIAYFHHQDCGISGDETADRGTQTSDDDASNGDTQPSSEFKPGARRAISVHMQTLINKFEQRS